MSYPGKRQCLSHTSCPLLSRLPDRGHSSQPVHRPWGSCGHLAQGGIWWLSGYRDWWVMGVCVCSFVRWVSRSPRKCGWSKKWFECMSWENIFDFSRSSGSEGTFSLNGPFTAWNSGCLCLREVEVGPGGIVSESSHHNMLNTLATGVFCFSLKRLVMSRSVFMFFIRTHMFIVCLCLTGIPDCSEEDLSVARALNLRWTTVLKSDEDGTQTLVNSDEVRTHHW